MSLIHIKFWGDYSYALDFTNAEILLDLNCQGPHSSLAMAKLMLVMCYLSPWNVARGNLTECIIKVWWRAVLLLCSLKLLFIDILVAVAVAVLVFTPYSSLLGPQGKQGPAFGAMISGSFGAASLSNRPFITNACPRKRSRKLVRWKLVPIFRYFFLLFLAMSWN